MYSCASERTCVNRLLYQVLATYKLDITPFCEFLVTDREAVTVLTKLKYPSVKMISIVTSTNNQKVNYVTINLSLITVSSHKDHSRTLR